jgi:hypothetical protein
MPTAVRRAAWAEWAGWTCKERRRSLLFGARTSIDRETPAGKPAGVFVFGIAQDGLRKIRIRAIRPDLRRVHGALSAQLVSPSMPCADTNRFRRSVLLRARRCRVHLLP